MSSAAKRLDLRFGAFACSVRGFDDPVQPVQQILRAIQHLLEESPELSDTAINFDAEAIEQLIGEVARRSELDESQIEIVPGLVIVHHGGDAALAASDLAAGGSAASDVAAEDRPGSEYVNIFAPAGGSAEEPAAEETDDSETTEDFADRLRRMATDDDYGWSEDEAGEAEPTESARELPPEDEERDSPNLFAAGDKGPDEGGEAGQTVRNLFAMGPGEPQDDWELAPASEEEDEAENQGGLSAADLAGRAGAKSVPELMLASAAWMVLMQGQTSFTRRDVLDVFETIPGDHENTPEARIKGFGKAVRNGQMVMTGDGIFGLSRSEVERFQSLL